MPKYFFLALILVFFSCSTTEEKAGVEEYQADVIIYGGTSAAITSAVQIKKMGKSVIVVSPDKHLGGLSSSGLGFTDTGNKAVIGGLAREFYSRIYDHYQQDSSWKWQAKEEYGNKGQGTPAIDGDSRTMWIFEPHAAEQVFEDFVVENELEVLRDEWLDRANGVKKEGGRITSIQTLSGKVFQGKIFIDATYEGDLMAAAGVSYLVGRESNELYGETWNGVQVGVYQHRHYFQDSISAYQTPGDPTSGLVAEVVAIPPGKNGTADKRLQAYNYRMCLSRHPDNRVPFEKPEGYDPARYELLARVYEAGWDETFDKFDPIPNLKTDTNNHGPFSTDYIGKNYAYPEASYEEREEILLDHINYQKGLMYFLANDPSVPEKIREEMAQWGLAKDEFQDNGHWPHQIYVREARRMVGDYVMTEHEVLGNRAVPQPIGMGSYSLDSHNVQRFVTAEGHVQNEGDIGVHPKMPYSISYGTLLPKKSECSNLLVPVCVSSSHTAFGSIRMEPVFMILGQSAAVAASLAIDNQQAVQDVDFQELKKMLHQENQVLELNDQL
ncbi:FAD-dependent oxidoreductase [Algoriphagus machipongonensis]|uniref:Probable secreted protein-putative xanthan lyase related protein n=1 Tax=Algoriphagus machipongonensis TaxID=388413 RepID=A3I195_9BACT|nr:FAD-dependent oxidoreductase [Algoriphagus machipongonensis]EAZ79561.1 probable secreted protein-putative xanthan lyase related protein [Algoriphagus machipongonensis]